MKPHQSLIYYKRHTPACDHSGDKFYLDCDCMIWITGRTPTGTPVPRQSTGATDIVLARKFGQELTAKSVAALPKSSAHGYTLPDAMEAFLLSKKDSIKDSVYDAYVRIFNSFAAYCYTLGVSYMREIRVDTIERYRDMALKNLKPSSREATINKLRVFFAVALVREWIDKPLAEQVSRRTFKRVPTEPYTDEEVTLILEGAEATANGNGLGKEGHTFRLLLELMLQTGMRVGDAVLFQPVKLRRGAHFWKYTFEPEKQKLTSEKKMLTVYIPDHLKSRIEACKWTTDTMPFYPCRPRLYKADEPDDDPKSKRPGQVIWDLMQTLGKKVGVRDCRPHRLRDTFAVRQLRSGATLDEVSTLLGHASVTMTERYYARWTTERADRLEQRFAALSQIA